MGKNYNSEEPLSGMVMNEEALDSFGCSQFSYNNK